MGLLPSIEEGLLLGRMREEPLLEETLEEAGGDARNPEGEAEEESTDC